MVARTPAATPPPITIASKARTVIIHLRLLMCALDSQMNSLCLPLTGGKEEDALDSAWWARSLASILNEKILPEYISWPSWRDRDETPSPLQREAGPEG
eukprot:scaffold48370_cov34-Prasinocladus_malaysianus.AAC.1